jgi:hypothetical protein
MAFNNGVVCLVAFLTLLSLADDAAACHRRRGAVVPVVAVPFGVQPCTVRQAPCMAPPGYGKCPSGMVGLSVKCVNTPTTFVGCFNSTADCSNYGQSFYPGCIHTCIIYWRR